MSAIVSKVKSFLLNFKWYRERYTSIYRTKIKYIWHKTGGHLYEDIFIIPMDKTDFSGALEKANVKVKYPYSDFAIFYFDYIGENVYPVIYTNFIPDNKNIIHQCILAHEYGHWIALSRNKDIFRLPLEWELSADLWAAEKIGISIYIPTMKQILEGLYGEMYFTLPEVKARLNNLESHFVKYFDHKAVDNFISTTIQ